MRKYSVLLAQGILAVASVSLLTGCGEREVGYQADVMPIIKANCAECHINPMGEGIQASGLDLSDYDTLMKGTKHGPIVSPGQAINSTLNRLVEGKADPSIAMPHHKEPLSEKDQKTIRAWVNQGAKNN